MRKSDAPEAFWRLKLDSPTCADRAGSQPDFNPARKEISMCVAKSVSGKRVQGGWLHFTHQKWPRHAF